MDDRSALARIDPIARDEWKGSDLFILLLINLLWWLGSVMLWPICTTLRRRQERLDEDIFAAGGGA
jgi:hypothetical protein